MSGMFGRVIVFLCCTGVGWELAGRSGRRRQELAVSAQLVRRLTGELGYSMKPADELIGMLCREDGFTKLWYLRAFSDLEELPFPERWRRSVLSRTGNLDEDERQLLLRVGEVLGCYDLDTQLQQLLPIAEQLQQRAQELGEQVAKDRRLYTSLGPLAGLAACILL